MPHATREPSGTNSPIAMPISAATTQTAIDAAERAAGGEFRGGHASIVAQLAVGRTVAFGVLSHP